MSWRWAPLAAHCRRETKDRRNGWRAEPATSPKIRTRFRPPILMARLFRPLFEGVRLAETSPSQKTSVTSSTTFDGVAPPSAHALRRMAVVGRRGLFSLNERGSMRLRIVGERPSSVPLSGRDVSAVRPSRSEPHAPYPSRAACREAPATNADLRLKAAGMEPTNKLTGLGSCRLTPCLTPSVADLAPAPQGPDRRCPDALRRLRSPARGGRR